MVTARSRREKRLAQMEELEAKVEAGIARCMERRERVLIALEATEAALRRFEDAEARWYST